MGLVTQGVDRTKQALRGAGAVWQSFSENPTQLAAYHGIPIEAARRIAPWVAAGDDQAVAKFLAANPQLLYLWILLYGGVRSGKTFAIALRLWMSAARHPGNRLLVVRKRKEQLRNTFLDEFEKVGKLITDGHLDYLGELKPGPDGALEYLVHTSNPKEPSKIIFAIEPDGTDAEIEDRWRGYTVGGVVTEETNQLREISPTTLRFRVSLDKDMAGNKIPRWMASISNPVTKGHYLQKFKQEQETMRLLGRRPNCLVIHSRPADNVKHLPDGYEDELRATFANDPQKIAMLLEGKDGLLVDGEPVYGRVFSHLHIDAQIQYTPMLPLLRGWDFGFHRPACVFAQEDVKGCINILGELLGEDETAEQFADRVIAFTALNFPNAPQITDYGDPAGAQQTDKGDTTIMILRRKGVRMNYRPTGIDQGIKHIRNMLTRMRGKRPELAFSPACADLILAFERGYHFPKFKDGTFGPKPHKDGYFDHYADAIRYLLVNIRAIPGAETSDVSAGNPLVPIEAKGPEELVMD